MSRDICERCLATSQSVRGGIGTLGRGMHPVFTVMHVLKVPNFTRRQTLQRNEQFRGRVDSEARRLRPCLPTSVRSAGMPGRT